MATTEDRRETDSGIEIKPVYTHEDVAGLELEAPGEYPFTRGPYPDMYRGKPWTIRQYAGFGSAEETNARFRYLLERGQTGLSVAFDLPTQLGYDSDDPRAAGEVGRTGVAIDSIADMEILFDGIPLDRVSTSMTINAPAALLLLLYELVAEKQGVPPDKLRGTVQNDILKEYIARGNYIFPPRPSMRITTDLFAYCAERLPRFNTISVSGYHIREAGSTAVQEIAFTLANGLAYCRAAVEAGLSPDEFGVRLSFFFNAHNHFFQEVAKFRAARRLWAKLLRERLGVTNPRALALRFHAQTGGSTLTAQQPENNIVRVAIQALSAACGGSSWRTGGAFGKRDLGSGPSSAFPAGRWDFWTRGDAASDISSVSQCRVLLPDDPRVERLTYDRGYEVTETGQEILRWSERFVDEVYAALAVIMGRIE